MVKLHEGTELSRRNPGARVGDLRLGSGGWGADHGLHLSVSAGEPSFATTRNCQMSTVEALPQDWALLPARREVGPTRRRWPRAGESAWKPHLGAPEADLHLRGRRSREGTATGDATKLHGLETVT
jgi:hypothetical protein